MTTTRTGLIPILALTLIPLICPSSSEAHYLWVGITTEKGEAIANVYFEEGPWARDGGYLDPFVKGGKSWFRTVEEPKPKALEMNETKEPNKRWLSAPLPVKAPRSFESTGTFGVYRYGKTDVLLHYYAKTLDVSDHEDLHVLDRAEHLKLDIVPHDEQEKLVLTLLWNGKPAANRPVYLRGPMKFQINTKTDEKGRVVVEPKAEGLYQFRAYVELDEPGEYDGKAYSLIRHHATLTMNLPLSK